MDELSSPSSYASSTSSASGQQRTFAELVLYCMGSMDGLIPIALYRSTGPGGHNYVVTAPEPHTPLRASDAIFVLATTPDEEMPRLANGSRPHSPVVGRRGMQERSSPRHIVTSASL